MARSFAPDESPTDGNSSDSAVPTRVVGDIDPAVLAARLKWLMGSGSVASFARRCGIAESVLRSYLIDHRMPPLDKALAIATAAGVSLDWLATGRTAQSAGRGRVADTQGSGNADSCDGSTPPPLEAGVLEGILKAVLEAQGARATPAELAARVVDLYQRAMAADPTP